MFTRKHAYLSLVSLIILSTQLNAQTKLISHKSHSGKTSNFSKAYSGNLFDIGNSNFGMAPEIHVRKAQLDSLIFINDSTTVMVTSEHCYNPYDPSNRKKRHYNRQNPQKEKELRKRDTDTTTVWQAGRNIVVNHPVFNKSNTPEKIREIVSKDYYFVNPAEDIVITDNNPIESSQPINSPDITKEKQKAQNSGESSLFKGLWLTICIIVISTMSYGTIIR